MKALALRHETCRDSLAETSAASVERVARIAREYGREMATPTEARKILSLT